MDKLIIGDNITGTDSNVSNIIGRTIGYKMGTVYASYNDIKETIGFQEKPIEDEDGEHYRGWIFKDECDNMAMVRFPTGPESRGKDESMIFITYGNPLLLKVLFGKKYNKKMF